MTKFIQFRNQVANPPIKNNNH